MVMENRGSVLHLLGRNHQRKVRQLHELRLLEPAANRGMIAQSVLMELTTTRVVERWMRLNTIALCEVEQRRTTLRKLRQARQLISFHFDRRSALSAHQRLSGPGPLYHFTSLHGGEITNSCRYTVSCMKIR